MTAPAGGREPSWGAVAAGSDAGVEVEVEDEASLELGTEQYFWKMYASASSN